MKGKDNTFYIKDNLLREQGNMTELESRLQDHAEFMQLYDIQKEHNTRVSTIVDQRIADAEARAGGEEGGGDPPVRNQEEEQQPHHQHPLRKQQNKRQKFKLKKHEYAKQQQTLLKESYKTT